MRASEMLKITNENKSKVESFRVREILSRAKERANVGQTCVKVLAHTINNDDADHLISLGYKISYNDFDTATISWDKE